MRNSLSFEKMKFALNDLQNYFAFSEESEKDQ